MRFSLNTRNARGALSATMLALLAACGGGGDSTTTGSNGASTDGSSNAPITLNGQVTDGPIAEAQVCLFADGVQARNAAGDAICSDPTDTSGNYSIKVPRDLSGVLTLVASKGADIRLVSALGTLNRLLAAAAATGSVTPAELSTARITHVTTANYALADADHDGTVSEAELAQYTPDFSAVQKAATVIQAYIDGGQTALIGGATPDTLALASAAVQNKVLGTTGQTTDAWFADPANAQAIAASSSNLSSSLAGELAANFTAYKLTQTATQATTPPAVVVGTSSISCTTGNTLNVTEEADVEIAFDAARGIALLRYTDDNNQPAYIRGSYNPATGAFNLYELDPYGVSMTSGSTTYYHQGYTRHDGKIDSAGAIAGTFQEQSVVTWNRDATRQECTAAGSFTITKR